MKSYECPDAEHVSVKLLGAVPEDEGDDLARSALAVIEPVLEEDDDEVACCSW